MIECMFGADPISADPISGDPIAGVRSAIESAAAQDRSAWSGTARSGALVDLLATRERLDALIVAVAGEWDRDQAWAADGAVSPVSWLAHRTPLTRQDASTLVRTARHVARHERTAKALDAGDITAAHAEIAAHAAKHRQEHYLDHEDVILDAAGALSPADFRQVMQHWRNCVDAVADHEDATKDVEGNYLDVAATFEGVGHLDGRLDPVSTKTLIDVLDAMEPPDPTDAPKPRTLAQRRAAALMRLVCGDQAPKTVIDITMDVDALALRPSADLTRSCCEIKGHGPLSPAVARTLACDAAIGRVVTRGDSEVLDLGRRTRLVNPALRRTLELRDRGCVEAGCTAPAPWCDAHHIVHWTEHGPTSADNLELRCRQHHLLQHQRDLESQIHPRE